MPTRLLPVNLLKNPHLLLALATLIWGGNAVAGKFAIGHVSPMVLTNLRWAIAFVIIVMFARDHVKNDWATIRKNWRYLLIMGGVGYAVFNFFLYSALQYTSAINVTLEQSAMPLFIFIANYILYRIGVTFLQVIGYVLTLVGVVITITNGNPLGLVSDGVATINRGDMIMMGAVVAYASYSVALRSKPDMHWQSFLTALISGALLASFVGVGVEASLGLAQFPSTVQGITTVAYAGIFPSLLSQGMFIYGVEKLGANTAGIFINLVPVFGALLAVLLLGEQLHLFHFLAFILVVGGIYLAQSRKQT